jgi:acyl-CoA thioester hydrolase
MTEPLVTFRGVVYPWHCDHMGHMNVAWYVAKFDEATWSLFAAMGLTPSYLRSAARGMVAVEQRLAYKRELLAGDTVYVRSRVLEVRDKVVKFAHEMFNAETDELAATTEVTGVHIDRDARRAVPIPEHLLQKARTFLSRAT